MYDEWTRKSIELCKKPVYGEKLEKEIYPEEFEDNKSPRAVPVEKIHNIREAKHKGNNKKMLDALLSLEKRPFKDRFVSRLKKLDEPFLTDPYNAERVVNQAMDMDLSEIARGACQPKESNRRAGSLFENWVINNQKFNCLSPSEFDQKEMHYTDDPEIMDGSGRERKQFVQQELEIDISKEPDLLMKVRTFLRVTIYIIGEAKYVGASGGNQTKSVKDARKIAEEVNKSDENAIGIGIIDGDPLMEKRSKKGTKAQRIIRNTEQPMISALLLEEFVESLEDMEEY
jgi:hypothetical protein